jgi:hypothetical protein
LKTGDRRKHEINHIGGKSRGKTRAGWRVTFQTGNVTYVFKV